MRPDLDSSPIGVIGRVSRLSRLVDRRLAENFARFGLENWMYDVLATLRRSGPPHELTAGMLVRRTMVTTGAITNRIDRLAERGLVARDADADDRRKVLVRLTRRRAGARRRGRGGAHGGRAARSSATSHRASGPTWPTSCGSRLLTLGDDAAAF